LSIQEHIVVVIVVVIAMVRDIEAIVIRLYQPNTLDDNLTSGVTAYLLFSSSSSSSSFLHLIHFLFTYNDHFIADLPDGWLAHVDKHTGQVVFLHYSSGISQYTVPPGYDDIPDSKVDFDKINSNDEELSMDDDTLLPSAENMESINNDGDDDVITKTGTEDTDGSGLSSVPLGRVDAFDQHDDNDNDNDDDL
jgi:hypothetical protein